MMNKTNKTDSENQMKAIDILHRQIQHLIILLIEVVKTLVNDQAETFQEKQNKRVFILDQCSLVRNWISNFQP